MRIIPIEINDHKYDRYLKSPSSRQNEHELKAEDLGKLFGGMYILTGKVPGTTRRSSTGLVVDNRNKVIGRVLLYDHMDRPRPGVKPNGYEIP